MVDGDTSRIKNFDDLYSEFCECIGGKELRMKLTDNAEMLQTKTKVMVAEMCMNMLRLRPSEAIFNLLRELNYNNGVSEFTEDNCEKLIKQVEPFVKLDAIDLQVMMNHSDKPTQGGGYSRDYFADMLIEMSTAFKLSLTDDMSVRTYCRWVVKYKNYVDAMNKQQSA
jgi:hypothetical protein